MVLCSFNSFFFFFFPFQLQAEALPTQRKEIRLLRASFPKRIVRIRTAEHYAAVSVTSRALNSLGEGPVAVHGFLQCTRSSKKKAEEVFFVPGRAVVPFGVRCVSLGAPCVQEPRGWEKIPSASAQASMHLCTENKDRIV